MPKRHIVTTTLPWSLIDELAQLWGMSVLRVADFDRRNIAPDYRARLDARLELMRSGLSVDQIFWLEVLKRTES